MTALPRIGIQLVRQSAEEDRLHGFAFERQARDSRATGLLSEPIVPVAVPNPCMERASREWSRARDDRHVPEFVLH